MKKIPALVLLTALSFSIAMAADKNTIKIDVLTKSSQSWDGAVLPAYPAQSPEITMQRMRIPAGGKLPLHKHPVINAGYLVKGRLVIEDEAGKKLEMKAGDAMVEMVDTLHVTYNPGDTEAEIVMFYAGTPHLPLSTSTP